ncbi:MAG: hypothetical protein B2I18_03885 [Cuniculiplasma sp. C_DKE]|nr:MAG: hypothetical protein B2I18_03885 [Cuniculiplasma sp. C_DKE]
MSNVVSIIVTFNPDIERFRNVIEPITKDGIKVVIVDNHSDNLASLKSTFCSYNIDYIELECNKGISSALNIGVKYVKTRFKPKWILLLDQDTIVDDNYSHYLIQHVKEKLKDFDKCCIIRGNERLVDRKDLILKFKTEILSGNLIRSSVFDLVQFREDFFMDFVDTDFFRKVAKLHLICMKDLSIGMNHSLGVKINVMGREMNYENSNRLFYMIRNSTILFAENPIDIKVVIAAYKNMLPVALTEGFKKTIKILFSSIFSSFKYIVCKNS